MHVEVSWKATWFFNRSQTDKAINYPLINIEMMILDSVPLFQIPLRHFCVKKLTSN